MLNIFCLLVSHALHEQRCSWLTPVCGQCRCMLYIHYRRCAHDRCCARCLTYITYIANIKYITLHHITIHTLHRYAHAYTYAHTYVCQHGLTTVSWTTFQSIMKAQLQFWQSCHNPKVLFTGQKSDQFVWSPALFRLSLGICHNPATMANSKTCVFPA